MDSFNCIIHFNSPLWYTHIYMRIMEAENVRKMRWMQMQRINSEGFIQKCIIFLFPINSQLFCFVFLCRVFIHLNDKINPFHLMPVRSSMRCHWKACDVYLFKINIKLLFGSDLATPLFHCSPSVKKRYIGIFMLP